MSNNNILAGNQSKKIAESKSLWNYALSPGWTQQEVEILKIALMKFGVGKWTAIEKQITNTCFIFWSGLESCQQSKFSNATYRLKDLLASSPQLSLWGVRKCGFLVNQGGKLTPEEKEKLRNENNQKYGLSPEWVEGIKLPAPCHLVEIYQIEKIMHPKSTLTTIEKIQHFIKLEDALLSKLDMIKEKRALKKIEQSMQDLSVQINEKSELEEDEQYLYCSEKLQIQTKQPKITQSRGNSSRQSLSGERMDEQDDDDSQEKEKSKIALPQINTSSDEEEIKPKSKRRRIISES
ncbi:UNKNOWN [Stylonychia lemnae]|uniref:Myb-like domain-containing protein n=1 Tax=Stylonychia lemnae TaxID=5949 RepID=A0A078A3S1_STYLE|nr:UNKNOWN [Stylonychia lemnae]|eukprot:CDW75399.1 UNKNOWN [Stylonychia lemnae]